MAISLASPKLVRVGLMVGIASLFPATWVGAQECRSGLVGQTSTNAPTCPENSGPSFPTNHTFTTPLTGSVCCANGCWRSAEDALEPSVRHGSGQCGQTGPNAPPLCEPSLEGPHYMGVYSNMLVFRSAVTSATFNVDHCTYSDPDTQDQSREMDGCCHTACTDYTACNLIGEYDGQTCRCSFSPIIIDLDGDGYRLTSAEDGVDFDLTCQGQLARWAWTARSSRDAFLVLDRDGDGSIGSGCELFGSVTPQPRIEGPNGFNALLPHDQNGDRRIDASDAVYDSLRLWIDANHDGATQRRELQSLAAAGVLGLSLEYRKIDRRDHHGNRFRYVSTVELLRRGRPVTERVFDIFLAGASCASPAVSPFGVTASR
jgi:hypothetical protein